MSTKYDTLATVDDFTADELRSLAREADISGRSQMVKDELYTELKQRSEQLLTPFTAAFEVEEGDEVRMNHLKSVLTVTRTEETDSHKAVVMETPRGGRHALILPLGDSEVGKNGSSPHLRRWRAGDEEWMNNSTDPVFIRQHTAQETEEAADEEEDDS